MHRFALTALLLAGAGLLTGCHNLERRYEPSGHRLGWDPVLGSCGSCGTCGGDCAGHTPASYIGHQLTCASGCGDIYWGSWLSTPPDDCDPCDDCGNWVGPQCCHLNWRKKFWAGLHGRHPADAGKGHGCETCGATANEVLISDGPVEVLPPAPAAIEPATASPQRRSQFQFRSARLER